MKSPTVTITGKEVIMKLFPDQTDGDSWAVVLKEGDESVFLAHVKNYEACLETMETIMVSFAALGYKLDSEF
jgi:hypothetical protein